jgi:hypothetical protein
MSDQETLVTDALLAPHFQQWQQFIAMAPRGDHEARFAAFQQCAERGAVLISKHPEPAVRSAVVDKLAAIADAHGHFGRDAPAIEVYIGDVISREPQDLDLEGRWTDFDEIVERLAREREEREGRGGNGREPPPLPEHIFDPWERYIVPPFPLDVLPEVAQKFVRSQSMIIGCDISGMAMSTIGVFSGALHHGFGLRMMRNGDWYASPRLWVLLVAGPSERKTPTLKAAARPLVHYEAHLRVKHEADLRDFEIAKSENEASKLREPKPPPRYLVWDTTVEKLGELLTRSDKGILVLSDEISGWLGSMERYNAGRSDRAFWLQAYDGGPHSIDRIKRGELHVRNLSVSILGCIQPQRLAEIQGLTSDGLLQRYVPVMMSTASFPQDCACADEAEAYSRLVRELIFAKPARLIMDDAALKIMDELRRYLFDIEQTSGGLSEGFQSFVGKLQGIAGTLALILHMAHDPQHGATYPVEGRTIANVRRLMIDFILPHGYEFYRGAETSTGERLRQIASWILTSSKQRIVASDLTSNIADLRGLSLYNLNERMDPLVAVGWLNRGAHGPTNNVWNVNQHLAPQFAERARSEQARKAKLALLMRPPEHTP